MVSVTAESRKDIFHTLFFESTEVIGNVVRFLDHGIVITSEVGTDIPKSRESSRLVLGLF